MNIFPFYRFLSGRGADGSHWFARVDLVWSSIDTSLGSVGNLLWEEPDAIREQFHSFQRVSSVPLLNHSNHS